MNHTSQSSTDVVSKKAYVAPAVRRDARLPIITAGSFDLIIPGPKPPCTTC